MWQEAIDYAYARGLTIVAAAGNGNEDLDAWPPLAPAALEHVIAVGATNGDDERCDLDELTCGWEQGDGPAASAHGSRLDVMAPGSIELWTTGLVNSGSYVRFRGTSASAPFVSGLAALILSVNPNLNHDQIESLIRDNALDLGEPGHDNFYGAGRIDAFNTVHAVEPPSPPPGDDTTPPTATGFTASSSGQFANLSTSGVSDNPGGSGVREVRFSGKWEGVWHGIGFDNTAPYTLTWDMCLSGVPDGDVELGMEVWDYAGNVFIWSSDSGHTNPHITKTHNCTPPQPTEGVYVYRDLGLGGGSCYLTQNAADIAEYCSNNGYGNDWNDNAESVAIFGSYLHAFFIDVDYVGGEPFVGGYTGDLPPEWRNQISSAKIRRTSPANFTLWS